jgi:hypothetical protein
MTDLYAEPRRDGPRRLPLLSSDQSGLAYCSKVRVRYMTAFERATRTVRLTHPVALLAEEGPLVGDLGRVREDMDADGERFRNTDRIFIAAAIRRDVGETGAPRA